MQLNWLERWFILSPLRAFLMHHLEVRQLLKMGGPLPGSRVLETGCGPGFGVDPLYRRFKAARVDAFDLDPKMIALVRKRQRTGGRPNRLWVGNLRHIPVADASYDAVVNFGAIHHVPDWRGALREIHRVMKPGGRFYVEEVLKGLVDHSLARRLFAHPRDDRFDFDDLVLGLESAGFEVVAAKARWRAFAWIAARKGVAA